MKFAVAIALACAVVVAKAATKCEEERLTATNNGELVGAFIPVCDEDGTYAELQCHGSTGYCYCARHDGTKINEPARGKYESCKCVRQRALELEKNLIGAFVPQCQENGKYEEKQCWGSTGTCWCANELTGEKVGTNAANC